jgi:hypothetical protein
LHFLYKRRESNIFSRVTSETDWESAYAIFPEHQIQDGDVTKALKTLESRVLLVEVYYRSYKERVTFPPLKIREWCARTIAHSQSLTEVFYEVDCNSSPKLTIPVLPADDRDGIDCRVFG